MATVSVALPRFVIAKYVPDLDRMEPRNIGVFLWARGDMAAKFLDATIASAFVTEMDVYSRWINFWTKAIASGTIQPRRGDPVPTSDPASLDALLATQKGNYILTDAGELMQSIRKKDASKAVDFLFRELVSTKTKPSAREDRHGFADRCVSLLRKAGLAGREDFKEHYEVECAVYGVPQQLHFSYGVGNGHPDALLQRVQLTNEQSVTSSATKLHSLIIGSSIIPRKYCRALVRKSDMATKAAKEGYRMLEGICEVVDVESDGAEERLADLAPKALD